MELDPTSVLREVARLRRIQRARAADGELGRELEPTIALLARAIGSTLKRSVAARVLGISQTALDRWIAAGEIGTIRTPSGRTEVPVGEVLDLLEEIGSSGAPNRRVAVAVRRRRSERSARSLGVELLPSDTHGHRRAELRGLAYHRVLGSKLDEQRVAEARARLERWQAEGRIHPRWAREWENVLDRPITQIVEVIGADDPHSAELRQNSPFAGMLADHERRQILRALERTLA